MSWWRDIWRQSIFLCFFIIPIPIGSYTIHNGSSAVVALAVYGVLSFIVPLCYIRSRETRFGRQDKAISVCAYIAAWLLLAGGSCWVPAVQKTWWQMSVFWQWPTIARDIVFIAVMYVFVSVTLVVAYGFSGLLSCRHDRQCRE
ncbi:hypothetical protein [uncultured Megasphaera sp.]|jgi:hypothetical protein|uniref:hypothetical protein n=1 Tax=uncultured Megasphaera sp. TaxID=165188 RepID=UPI0007823C5E|nr:hypothetical protein [uncultured Megasphaera sp.]KXB90995.1 hypothetical protein HMPREF3033_01356 [Veillonellaceae bacterium DNF00751]MUP50774.1 hypothetical protein [Veillonellaceae bacterium M1-70]